MANSLSKGRRNWLIRSGLAGFSALVGAGLWYRRNQEENVSDVVKGSVSTGKVSDVAIEMATLLDSDGRYGERR